LLDAKNIFRRQRKTMARIPKAEIERPKSEVSEKRGQARIALA